ncbi:MAG TPA: LLM class flavin-dependent oxidoreductase, partial [Thermoleophilaceae bacterium]|nr:LLM class flavin-dependent oxidoreductase [Thermoleophilaceae bacterium]
PLMGTEFGFMMGLSPREPIARFGDLAHAAEELGFGAAWLADSQLYTKDVYVGLALAAARTSRIALGPGVTNPVTRHLTVTANAISGIDEVSGGRALLGLGAGDAAVFPLGLPPARIAELRETIRALRALSRGEDAQFDDARASVAAAGSGWPILLAASQPRMLELAGAEADGVILMGAADPALTSWQLERIAAGAEKSGRNLSDLAVDLWFTISLSEDRAQALQDVRPWAISQARWFSRWRELPEPLRPFADELRRAAEAHEFSRHLARGANGRESVSDEFVDWVGVAGDLAHCVAKIRPLVALDVDRITFALLPGGRAQRLERYGRELIPALNPDPEPGHPANACAASPHSEGHPRTRGPAS